jgi:hypothetical protein
VRDRRPDRRALQARAARPRPRDAAPARRDRRGAPNCAIVAVHHTTKAGEVGGPNSGLRGTARAVYVYGFDPDDEDRRALSVDKINGVAEPPAILFEQEVVEYSVGDTCSRPASCARSASPTRAPARAAAAATPSATPPATPG